MRASRNVLGVYASLDEDGKQELVDVALRLLAQQQRLSTTVPAIECPAWCVDDEGHAREHMVEDQEHRGERRHVALSQPQLLHVPAAEGEPKIDACVQLWRGYRQETVVLVSLGEQCEIALTLAEAKHLFEAGADLVQEATVESPI